MAASFTKIANDIRLLGRDARGTGGINLPHPTGSSIIRGKSIR
jgi:fumarate hydratase class II